MSAKPMMFHFLSLLLSFPEIVLVYLDLSGSQCSCTSKNFAEMAMHKGFDGFSNKHFLA